MTPTQTIGSARLSQAHGLIAPSTSEHADSERTVGPSRIRALLTILIVGLIIRLSICSLSLGLIPRIADESDYIQLARQLATTGEYAYEPGHPTSLRPPLYPLFVAGVFCIAGVDNYLAVRLVQALLSLGTCTFVYNIGRLAWSTRTGLWAAGVCSIYPSFLGYNNLILSEVLFIFLTTAGALALIWGLKRGLLTGLMAGGVLFALGALTRSILLPFAPVLCLFLIVVWKGSPVRRVVAALAFALPFTGLVTPWAIRNTSLQSAVIPIDCMGGRNFMMGNYEHTPLYRSWDAISISEGKSWIDILFAHHPEVRDDVSLTQGQIDQMAMKDGVRFVRENPGLTARRDIFKFFDFWGLERELIAGAGRGYFGTIPIGITAALGFVICVAYILVLFAGAFGAALNPPSDWRVHLLFLLVIFFMCAVHTAVFAHSRYHLPVMPFVIVYAASFATRSRKYRHRGRLDLWLACGFCVIVGIGWLSCMVAGDLGKIHEAFTIDG